MDYNISESTVNEIRNILNFYYKSQWWSGQVMGVTIPIQSRTCILVSDYLFRLNPVITDYKAMYLITGFTAVWILDHENKKYYIEFYENGKLNYDVNIKQPVLVLSLKKEKLETISNMDDFKEFIYYVDNSRLHASLLMNKMVDPIVSSGYLSIPGTDNKIDFKTISTINVCIKTPNELLYIWQNTFKRKTIDNTDNN